MPTSTYVALGTITLASTDSEIVFSSIPATYRDLIVVINARSNTTGTAEVSIARFNGDTGANYSTVFMQGTGSTSASATETRFQLGRTSTSSGGSTNFGTMVTQIFDYSATDKQKTGLSRWASPVSDAGVGATAARWANTDAIHTITITQVVGTAFAIGSTFSIYGLN